MIKRPQGLWRTRRPRPLEDDARTEDSTGRSWTAESIYRAKGYQPSFDQLPWKDDAGNDA